MSRMSVTWTLVALLGLAALQANARGAADRAPALEFQKKLTQRIDYELLVPTTLDRILFELLDRQGVPTSINVAAFAKAGAKDSIAKIQIENIDAMHGVSRARVLKKLLEQVPADSDRAKAIYIVRAEFVEITTWEAYMKEFFPRKNLADLVAPPPLAYLGFEDAPLGEALADVARSTETSVVVDPSVADKGKTKVTAELVGVPVEDAVRILADSAGLKLVRVGNVYYVTSPENAQVLRDEDKKPRMERRK